MFSKLLTCTCGEKWQDIAPLILRIALGLVFLMHGYSKIFVQGHAGVTGFLGGLGFPMPSVFAAILMYGEFIGGALLIVGLLTHWVAKFDIVIMLTALFLVHWKNGFMVSNGGYEFVMLMIAAAVSLMITGAGKYSLDDMWLNKKMGNPIQ
jgi:putative oxidoreductase